jgi:ankyrin repeat domain-containing protein 17
MDVPEPLRDARAIVAAAHYGHLEEVQRLVQQDRRLLDANDGISTPLTEAAQNGHLEVIRYLLAEGAQLNLVDPVGWTPFFVACISDKPEAASLLLAHGADAATVNDEGGTPLIHASAGGHARIVALLLAHGCGDIDRRSGGGLWAALHCASCSGGTRMVRALLEAGADPHVVDRDGKTPRAVAVGGSHEQCVAVLEVCAVGGNHASPSPQCGI